MLNDLEKKKINYINKWGNDGIDEKLEKFSKIFDEWFAQIPTEYENIVLELLDNFNYYSKKCINRHLVELNEKLKKCDFINDDNIIYTFIKSSDGISNSSNDYWTEYKVINNIEKNLFVVDTNKIKDEGWQYVKNIVIIDDCSGTGESFISMIDSNIDRYKQKNILFLTIHILEIAYKNIMEYASKNNIKINIININFQKIAFSKEIFGDNSDINKEKIIKMSDEFGIELKWALGFKESQGLMAFYNNTPNNTLGFLWKENKNKYFPIFPREHEKIHPWNIKRSKEGRKKSNYNSIKRSNRNA